MADDNLRSRLRELLASHCGAPVSSLTDQSTAQNTEGWDSVANLSLMVDVEDEFGVTIGTQDAMRMKSLADLAAFIEAARRGG